MFSTKHLVKPTLLCGPKELSKSFMFEAAIYWAEEGRRVVYITPAPLESLPAACHDRSNPAPAAFKLMRFMYLENYEALIERLVELHTFVTLPSVLLIDDFDAYANDYQKNDVSQDVHISRMCSLILDTMNSCSRILKNSVSKSKKPEETFKEIQERFSVKCLQVYVCAWSSTAMNDISTYSIYFRNIWNIKDEEGKTILLEKYSNEGATEKCPSYRYCRLQDGTRILKQILHEPSEN